MNPTMAPAHQNMTTRLWRLCLCAASVAGLTYCASASAQTPLTVHGGDNAVWAFRSTEPNADGRSQLQFAYAVPGKTSMRFRTLLIAPTYGEIAQSAVCGTHLYVFFKDGSHYRFRPPPRSQAPDEQDRNESHELTLPQNAIPLALCGDDKKNTLTAIVAAESAVFSIGQSFAEAEDVGTTGNTPEEGVVATTGFALVEYTGNEWRYLSAVPDLLDGSGWCRLVTYDNVCHLVLKTDSAKTPTYLRWDAPTNRWSQPEAVGEVADQTIVGLVANEDTVALLVAEPADDSNRLTLSAVERRDDGWTTLGVLELDGKPANFPADATAVDRFRDELIVATLVQHEDKTLVDIGFWPLAGGQPNNAPRTVRALTKLPDLAERRRLHMLVATAVLVASLVFVFVKRRDSFAKDCTVPPGYIPATLGRRLSAVLLDMIIVSSLAAPVLWGPWLEKHGIPIDDSLWIEMDNVIAHNPDSAIWLWAWTAALFALYCIVSETATGATPGKLLLGLRVCSEEGGRVGLAATIIRNVLRIELYFLLHLAPTAILIVLTRNRQRIGDLIARTTVVEKRISLVEKHDESGN